MNILAIGGSPRRNGNSNSLMRIAVEAAVERGAKAEYIYPKELDIQGCDGCGRCRMKADSVCAVDDDIIRVYDLMRWADVVVFASPVYFYGLSSWIKEIVDRFYALITPEADDEEGASERPPRLEPGKGLYFVSSQQDDSVFYGYSVMASLVYGMTWLGMVHRGQLIATGLDKAGDWKTRDDLQAAARELIVVE